MESSDRPTTSDAIVREELEKLQEAMTTFNRSVFRARAVLYGRLNQPIDVELQLLEAEGTEGLSGQFVTAHINGQLLPSSDIGEHQMSPNSWQRLLGDGWRHVLHPEEAGM